MVSNLCLFEHTHLVGATVGHEAIHKTSLKIVQALELRLFP